MSSPYGGHDVGTRIRRAAAQAGLVDEPTVEQDDDVRSWEWLLGIHDSGVFIRLFVKAFPSPHGLTIMYGVKSVFSSPDISFVDGETGNEAVASSNGSGGPAVHAKFLNIKNVTELDEIDLALRLLDAQRWIESA